MCRGFHVRVNPNGCCSSISAEPYLFLWLWVYTSPFANGKQNSFAPDRRKVLKELGVLKIPVGNTKDSGESRLGSEPRDGGGGVGCAK